MFERAHGNVYLIANVIEVILLIATLNDMNANVRLNLYFFCTKKLRVQNAYYAGTWGYFYPIPEASRMVVLTSLRCSQQSIICNIWSLSQWARQKETEKTNIDRRQLYGTTVTIRT